MKLLTSKALAECRAFWSSIKDQDTHSAPLIMADPPTPLPPEPSCFVKGLIHSMKTEPESWKRNHLFHSHYWTHRNQSVHLYEGSSEPYHYPSSPLPEHESMLLAIAIQEYLVQPMIQRAEQEAKEEEAAKRAHFEKLGCPEKTS